MYTHNCEKYLKIYINGKKIIKLYIYKYKLDIDI